MDGAEVVDVLRYSARDDIIVVMMMVMKMNEEVDCVMMRMRGMMKMMPGSVRVLFWCECMSKQATERERMNVAFGCYINQSNRHPPHTLTRKAVFNVNIIIALLCPFFFIIIIMLGWLAW